MQANAADRTASSPSPVWRLALSLALIAACGLFKFALATLEALADGAELRPEDAEMQTAIPSHAQGGAIDGDGNLWISRSDAGWGFFDKLNPRTKNAASDFRRRRG